MIDVIGYILYTIAVLSGICTVVSLLTALLLWVDGYKSSFKSAIWFASITTGVGLFCIAGLLCL